MLEIKDALFLIALLLFVAIAGYFFLQGVCTIIALLIGEPNAGMCGELLSHPRRAAEWVTSRTSQ